MYPSDLLPKKNYPLLKNEDIINNALVRETIIDIYQFITTPEYEPEDIMPLVVAPQPSLREVFELSTYLYGYYNEQYAGIKVNNTEFNSVWNNKLPEVKIEEISYTQREAYLLFLAAEKLDKQEIDFNGKAHFLSFSHMPTRVNYWHFELLVKDSAGNRIPRDKNNTHTKYLAKSILEYIIAKAIINKKFVNIFKRFDFEINY